MHHIYLLCTTDVAIRIRRTTFTESWLTTWSAGVSKQRGIVICESILQFVKPVRLRFAHKRCRETSVAEKSTGRAIVRLLAA